MHSLRSFIIAYNYLIVMINTDDAIIYICLTITNYLSDVKEKQQNGKIPGDIALDYINHGLDDEMVSKTSFYISILNNLKLFCLA